MSTGMLRRELLKLINNDINRFFVFSPSELKNSINCKGNAPKLDILNQFKEDPIIEKVKESDLYQIVKNQDIYDKKNNIISPISDLIDSYLGIIKIYSQLK